MLLRTGLAVEDSEHRARLEGLLSGLPVRLVAERSGSGIWPLLAGGPCDLLLAEEAKFGDKPADHVREVRDLPNAPQVVVLVGRADPTWRAEMLAAGVFAILDLRATDQDLLEALGTLVERCCAQARADLRAERESSPIRLVDFATNSPVMREFLAVVRRVVNSDSTLLVHGETGVGKEFLSRAIHVESPRARAPFIAVNCSALSETLLESELFGHVEGAFTGAKGVRRGYFELAHEGTLLIDEVGELSPQLQVKLLRVVQDRVIRPVGSEEEFEVDVRIIAATNLDLAAEMERGAFRPDLYYRLSVVTLEIPPLRLRREDIAGMVESHLEHFRILLRRNIWSIREDALELLVGYSWPGNVRELVNVVERAVLLGESEEITPADLPEQIRAWGDGRPADPDDLSERSVARVEDVPEPEAELLSLRFREAREELIAGFERRYIVAALARCHGRVSDAARIAGLNPRSFYAKMQRYRLRKEHYKLDASSR